MIWLTLGSPDLISMEHEGLSFGLYPVSDLLLGLLFKPDRASNEASSFLVANFRDYLLSLSPTGLIKFILFTTKYKVNVLQIC